MKTHFLIMLILLFLFLPFLPQSPINAETRAVTYTVNSDTDAPDANLGDSICAAAGGNCTLHAAIQNANQDG